MAIMTNEQWLKIMNKDLALQWKQFWRNVFARKIRMAWAMSLVIRDQKREIREVKKQMKAEKGGN